MGVRIGTVTAMTTGQTARRKRMRGDGMMEVEVGAVAMMVMTAGMVVVVVMMEGIVAAPVRGIGRHGSEMERRRRRGYEALTGPSVS